MNDFYLKGKVIEIVPVAIYEGKVYTQNIIFELENGVQIEIDDSLKKCKKSEIGKEKYIQIRAFTVQPIIKNENKEIKIIPYGKHKGPHADIYGYIEKILFDKPENWVILNAGVGKIILYADDKQINGLFEKDFIVVKGGRLDLGEIKDV